MNIWTFSLAIFASWLAFEYGLHKHRGRKKPRLGSIKIILKEHSMIVGQPTPFHVVAFDTDGNAFPMPPDLVVTVDNGTFTINPDGTGGFVTPAAAGPVNVTATAGGKSDTATDSATNPAPVFAGVKVILGS